MKKQIKKHELPGCPVPEVKRITVPHNVGFKVHGFLVMGFFESNGEKSIRSFLDWVEYDGIDVTKLCLHFNYDWKTMQDLLELLDTKHFLWHRKSTPLVPLDELEYSHMITGASGFNDSGVLKDVLVKYTVMKLPAKCGAYNVLYQIDDVITDHLGNGMLFPNQTETSRGEPDQELWDAATEMLDNSVDHNQWAATDANDLLTAGLQRIK